MTSTDRGPACHPAVPALYQVTRLMPNNKPSPSRRPAGQSNPVCANLHRHKLPADSRSTKLWATVRSLQPHPQMPQQSKLPCPRCQSLLQSSWLAAAAAPPPAPPPPPCALRPLPPAAATLRSTRSTVRGACPACACAASTASRLRVRRTSISSSRALRGVLGGGTHVGTHTQHSACCSIYLWWS